MNPFNKLYSRKSTTVPKIPLYLDIELTNFCNLKCRMCGTNYSKRKKGYMDELTFFRILAYVSQYKIPVRLIGWGENTLHDKFREWKDILMENTIVHLNTNGTTITAHNGLSVTSLKISEHCYREPYFNWCVNHSVGATPHITIHSTDMELKGFKKPIVGIDKINKTDTRWIDGKNRSTKRFKRCGEVFDKLTILWNGDITACCGDVEGKLILGNINKDDLLDIWKNSKQLNYIRKELRKKNWNCTELCKNCYSYV